MDDYRVCGSGIKKFVKSGGLWEKIPSKISTMVLKYLFLGRGSGMLKITPKHCSTYVREFSTESPARNATNAFLWEFSKLLKLMLNNEKNSSKKNYTTLISLHEIIGN